MPPPSPPAAPPPFPPPVPSPSLLCMWALVVGADAIACSDLKTGAHPNVGAHLDLRRPQCRGLSQGLRRRAMAPAKVCADQVARPAPIAPFPAPHRRKPWSRRWPCRVAAGHELATAQGDAVAKRSLHGRASPQAMPPPQATSSPKALKPSQATLSARAMGSPQVTGASHGMGIATDDAPAVCVCRKPCGTRKLWSSQAIDSSHAMQAPQHMSSPQASGNAAGQRVAAGHWDRPTPLGSPRPWNRDNPWARCRPWSWRRPCGVAAGHGIAAAAAVAAGHMESRQTTELMQTIGIGADHGVAAGNGVAAGHGAMRSPQALASPPPEFPRIGASYGEGCTSSVPPAASSPLLPAREERYSELCSPDPRLLPAARALGGPPQQLPTVEESPGPVADPGAREEGRSRGLFGGALEDVFNPCAAPRLGGRIGGVRRGACSPNSAPHPIIELQIGSRWTPAAKGHVL